MGDEASRVTKATAATAAAGRKRDDGEEQEREVAR